MHRISAALACLAVVVTAGCGTARSTVTTHPSPPCPHATGLTQADSGKTYCVRVGDQISVLLGSTRQDMWLEPLASGNALKGVPNGMASLAVGVTGAWYEATRQGRSVVTSVRPPCRAAANSAGTSYPVGSCTLKDRFTVTIIAS